VARDRVDAAAAGDAGVVAEKVNFTETRKRCGGGTIDAPRGGDVAFDTLHLQAQLVEFHYRVAQPAPVDGGEHHPHAGFTEGPAEGPANPARTARNKSGFAGKVVHDPPLLARCRCGADCKTSGFRRVLKTSTRSCRSSIAPRHGTRSAKQRGGARCRTTV